MTSLRFNHDNKFFFNFKDTLIIIIKIKSVKLNHKKFHISSPRDKKKAETHLFVNIF